MIPIWKNLNLNEFYLILIKHNQKIIQLLEAILAELQFQNSEKHGYLVEDTDEA